jgi:LPS export ABC transporter protein LptC
MDDYFQFRKTFIAVPFILGLAMLFSCENDIKKVKELTNAKELPVIHATGVETIYSDSAIVRSKITAPELKEFSETEDREAYIEFPRGMKAVFYNQAGWIESSLEAQYAVYSKKTKQFEARTNVIVKNFSEKQELYTEQLFWDQEAEKIWSDKFVKIITENGPTYGEEGFESDHNFTKFRIKKSRGQMTVEDEN